MKRISLRQNPLHPMGAFDSGQAEVEAGVAVGEAFVIKPRQVQNGGVKIAHLGFTTKRAQTTAGRRRPMS